MGFLERVERTGGNTWTLPAVGGMRCPVTAFLDETLFALTDERLWAQAAMSASQPGATGMYLMPDTHVGFGIPIGGVLVTEDTIVQAGSGYDISCGVVYLRVEGLTAADVADRTRRERWVAEVERRIHVGIGSGRQDGRLARRTDEILRHGAKALGVPAELCERQFIPVPDDMDFRRLQKAYAKVAPQFGSVGGGNHFIELQVDADDGSVWAMIHCGSRGYGWQVANHFFHKGAELRGLPRNRREESWLRRDEPLGEEYWAWHNSAANFAVANRHVIVDGVNEALDAVWGQTGRVWYEISHNLVQEETLLLPDGTTRRGFVHRKGATRAFPPGHPDLVGTRWERTGHPCLIPGSMRDGAAILYPLPGAARSGCSVNHGSGRVMARGEARRDLSERQDEIDAEMDSITRTLGGVEVRGIVGNHAHTPLDECGHVYKDLDRVLAVLEDEGIARVDRRLYPVANLKGVN